MPYLTLTTEDNEALNDLNVDDEAEITVIARVTRVGREGGSTHKMLEFTCAVTNVKQKQTSLSEAVRRAGEKHLMVRTQTDPAGG